VRNRILLIAVLLISSSINPAYAGLIYEIPKQVSFTVDKTEIELSSQDTTVNFSLTVDHPIGIATSQTQLSLMSRDGRFTFRTSLIRTDAPIQKNLNRVLFKGSITLPPYANSGIYDFKASPVVGLTNQISEYAPTSDEFVPENFHSFLDAQNALLVRKYGKLNLDNKTFVGPSYPSSFYIQDSKPITLFTAEPIYRVGEIYDPAKYFEKRVKDLQLEISSQTPETCKSDNRLLKFISQGNCQFKVFSNASNDYLETSISLNVSVLSAREKLTVNIPNLENQIVSVFPKQIELPQVFSSSGKIVNPKSNTSSVCVMSGTYLITLISAGICQLSYQFEGNDMFLSSDNYLKSFEVIKEGQPVVVPTPVVTPTPVATPTAKPVVKKTITCVKGKKTIKKTAVSPKCPKGFKLKR